MPGRKTQPPRLWLKNSGIWIILDRGRQISTGCSESEAAQAAEKLADYIARKYRPAIGERDPDRLPIADILVAYVDAKEPRQRDRNALTQHDLIRRRCAILNEFFGEKTVAEIRAQLCRDYTCWRTGQPFARFADYPRNARPVSSASARRELEDLRAAVNHYHAEFALRAVPKITLPAKSPPRDRWLTRHEAARLLGAALGFIWDRDRKAWSRDDAGRLMRRELPTRIRRLHSRRFILIALYSGRREETIRRTEWTPTIVAPWLDLDRWIYHGRGAAERRTKKRRPPAAIANRLRPHLTRWKKLDEAQSASLEQPIRHVIHKTNGQPLAEKINKGWISLLADAGLERDVNRHTLKHTAATWLMQSGPKNLWEAAGFIGVTVEQLQDYAHHHPEFQDEAASAFGGRRQT